MGGVDGDNVGGWVGDIAAEKHCVVPSNVMLAGAGRPGAVMRAQHGR